MTFITYAHVLNITLLTKCWLLSYLVKVDYVESCKNFVKHVCKQCWMDIPTNPNTISELLLLLSCCYYLLLCCYCSPHNVVITFLHFVVFASFSFCTIVASSLGAIIVAKIHTLGICFFLLLLCILSCYCVFMYVIRTYIASFFFILQVEVWSLELFLLTTNNIILWIKFFFNIYVCSFFFYFYFKNSMKKWLFCNWPCNSIFLLHQTLATHYIYTSCVLINKLQEF